MNQLNTLNGELQHIIDNVRQIGSNSTDIQSPGLHLSISVDNNKLLNKKIFAYFFTIFLRFHNEIGKSALDTPFLIIIIL